MTFRGKGRPSGSSADRGQVLILTLVLVAILALAAAELLVFLRPRLELSHYLVRRAALGSAAATGIDYASAVLSDDFKNSETDFLDEEWSREFSYRLDDVLVTVKIEDEERKFPLSMLMENAQPDTGEKEEEEGEDGSASLPEESEEVSSDTGEGEAEVSEAGYQAFEDLLSGLGLPPGWSKEVADSLADWLDSDDQPRSSGAESEYYITVGGYRARNGPARTLGELKLVRGFRPEITEKIFPHLSPFSHKINLNTASREVLEAVFGTGESLPVHFLIESRPFESVEKALKLAQIGTKIYNQLKSKFTVESSFFSVRSSAVDMTGREETVYAVLERNEEGVRTVYWAQLPSGSQSVPGRE